MRIISVFSAQYQRVFEILSSNEIEFNESKQIEQI